MAKVDDFNFVFSDRQCHQNGWGLVTVGVRTGIDEGGMGECPDIDVVILDIQNQQGDITKAIVGDIETVDKLIQLLQIAKANLLLKKSNRELWAMENKARKEIKQY